MIRPVRFALVLVALALTSFPASAQSSAAARSRTLFEQARGLADTGKWTEACPLFQAAHDLNSTGGTALQAANCYEKIDKLDRALALYQFILDNPEARKKQDRVAIAEERIRALREKLALPAPSASAPPAPSVSAPPAPSSSAPPAPSVSAPPGPSAPPPASAAPVLPVAPLAPTASVTTPRPPPPEVTSPSRVPAIVAFSVGGVGVVGGAIFGALAIAQASDVKSRCSDTECLASDQGNRDAAMTKGWVSTAGFGLGIAGAAVGVVLLVIRPSASKKLSATADGLVIHF